MLLHDDAIGIPADLDTPVSAFRKLAPFEPRFLLESVAGGEQVARYSLIGLGAARELRLENGRLVRSSVAGSVAAPVATAELIALLRAEVEQAPALAHHAVPFAGGLVGVTGFDLVRRLDRLPGLPPRTDALEGAWFAPASLLVFDHVTRRAMLLGGGSTVAEREGFAREIRRALDAPLPSRLPAVSRRSASTPTPRRGAAAYVDGVRRTQAAIRDGEVYQLVLSEAFDGESDLDPFDVYRALRLLNPSPYMFFVDLGDDHTVVGSSPEALVRLEGGHATLRPIAGTRPRDLVDVERDAALERELLADAKEAAEHVMLVDLARNDLGRVATAGSIAVRPSRIVERYSHVMHLVSGVEGTLAPGHDQFDLFAAAFPAGTVSGAPKPRALQLIDELEGGASRGVYAGTVGYFGRGGASMDQAIAIRTLELHRGRYSFRAGAGVVADSVPEREWDEVCAKGRALAEALRVAADELG